jgi:hypothetical protein
LAFVECQIVRANLAVLIAWKTLKAACFSVDDLIEASLAGAKTQTCDIIESKSFDTAETEGNIETGAA